MKHIITIIILFFLLGKLAAQEITIVDFKEFEPQLHMQNDTLYMVHFWATWCIPCIKEMPLIIEETKQFKNEKFKLVLVSFDFSRDIQSKLKPYLHKNGINQQIYVMDDPDYNSWIDKVDASWSGALPATLFYRNNKTAFYEGSFEENELNKTIDTNLKTL